MIPGYKVYRRDRRKGKGGGVLIYLKNSIDSHQIDIPDPTIECVGVTIKLSPQMSFIVLCVYRPSKVTCDFYTGLTASKKHVNERKYCSLATSTEIGLIKARGNT